MTELKFEDFKVGMRVLAVFYDGTKSYAKIWSISGKHHVSLDWENDGFDVYCFEPTCPGCDEIKLFLPTDHSDVATSGESK